MKNDVFRVLVEDLNPDGNGVGRLPDGQVVFVPLTAPGDECEVKIIREAKNYLVGRCERLLTPSPDRADPGCACYKRCGGCSFRHISPEAEAKRKESIVKNALLRIGGIQTEVAPIFCAGTERYRNKVVYPLAVRDGKPVFGYYARHTHTVIPHEDCPAQDRLFPEIAMFHVKQIERYGVSVRDELTGKGVLRHIAMRKNREGSFSVCFIASERFPQAKRMARELMEAFPQITGVALNRNDTPGNVIFGKETETLAGDPILTDTLCGKTFRVSPASFYQIHPDVAEKLYEKAAELADLPDGGVLLDLYCGAGTVGLSMIREGQKLCGAEIVPDAVGNAKENAKRNGRTEKDTLFVCDDASAGAEVCRKAFGKPDVIVTDPPRKGLSDAVIRTILAVSPEKIVCISCDPATLAANCKAFCANGYSCGKAFPFNMFPGTGHVETVVLLSRETATHDMHLNPEPFEMIKNGEKTIELRLFDEKRQKIKVGDRIVFTETVTGKKMVAKVKKLHRFDSFAALYKSLPLLKCGYTEKTVTDAKPSDMEKYYSAEEQKRYGVVGIEISEPDGEPDEAIILLTRKGSP